MSDQTQQKVLRRADDVVEAYGLRSRENLDNLVSDGEFPAPIKLGKRAVAWVESELQEWLVRKMAARDARRATAETAEVSA